MAKTGEDRKTEYDPLIITDRRSGGKYYGGDQNWYMSNTRAVAGCGSVACANMLRTLACKYPERFMDEGVAGELKALTGDVYYKDDFISLMGDIYRSMLVLEVPVIRRIYDAVKRDNKVFKVIPSNLGLSLNGFISGTLKFCRSKGLLLHVHALPTAFCSYDRGLEFIKEGLSKGGCIVMLTSLNRHPLRLYSGRSGELESGSDTKKGVRSHFMTITGIVDNGDDAPLIKLSTWGRVATVSYDKLNRSWHKTRAYTSCLYYFTPAGSDAVVRADMRNSVFVLCRAVFRGLFGWIGR
ncbi:MAG: hypothetical protein IKP31_07545 [Lachnospiraceae bacterium]|nr:hypothetical protein [Lachnospiraceae bacterium]